MIYTVLKLDFIQTLLYLIGILFAYYILLPVVRLEKESRKLEKEAKINKMKESENKLCKQ